MRYLAEIKKLITFMIQSQSYHALVISSPPGWAKTASTRDILLELDINYTLLGAYSTPLALYNKLASDAEDRGGEYRVACGFYVIDDTHGVLNNPQTLSILNAAAWPAADRQNTRQVIWTSTTEKSVVPGFIFEGKLLVLTNYLSNLPQAKAFATRALNLRIEIRAEELHSLFLEASQSQKYFPNQKLARSVAEFVAEQARSFEPGLINLRDLSRAYELATHFKSPREWQEIFIKTLPKHRVKTVSPEELVFELSQTGKKVSQQARVFNDQCGLGERKFFYLRQKLGVHSKVKSEAAKAVALARQRAGRFSSRTSDTRVT